MSHEIHEHDQMASAGGILPWHYSETQDRVAIDARSGIPFEEILPIAGMDWLTGKAPLFAQLPDGTFAPVEHLAATYNMRSGRVIGTCSPETPMVHNHQVADLMRAIIGESDAAFDTAGTLFNQQLGWFCLTLPQSIQVAGMSSETLQPYLFGTLGHAPKERPQPVALYVTLVRVVCKNTWDAAITGSQTRYTFAHQGDVLAKMEDIREALQLTFNTLDTVKTVAETLAQQEMTSTQVDDFLRHLVPVGAHADQNRHREAEVWAANRRQAIAKVWAQTPDLAPIRETRYGALQAVSAWECHHRSYGHGPQAAERKMATTVLGDSLTRRATTLLTGVASFGSATLDSQIEEILRTA